MGIRKLHLIAYTVVSFLFFLTFESTVAAETNTTVLTPQAKAMIPMFPPIKAATPQTSEEARARVNLGRQLFYDTRFSKNHDISCNTCHTLDQYGVDGDSVSTGHHKQKGTRNAPTVYNAADHFAQFWDYRAKDLEQQAGMPVLNPIEMALPDGDAALAVINSIPDYVTQFKKSFPGENKPVTFENFDKAIAAFERGLVTPAPWDRFVAGDEKALTDAQKTGFNTFIEVQCYACHMGTNFGGSMFQKVGLIHPWPNQSDGGRCEVTKNEADKMLFKVPSLRNVVKTGPYFHDGSVKKLDEAVNMMAWHQRGIKLTANQTQSIVAFLEALTGDIPVDYIKQPSLPGSTDNTPKPDPN